MFRKNKNTAASKGYLKRLVIGLLIVCPLATGLTSDRAKPAAPMAAIHLSPGFMEWLNGEIAGMTIKLPERIDLSDFCDTMELSHTGATITFGANTLSYSPDGQFRGSVTIEHAQVNGGKLSAEKTYGIEDGEGAEICQKLSRLGGFFKTVGSNLALGNATFNIETSVKHNTLSLTKPFSATLEAIKLLTIGAMKVEDPLTSPIPLPEWLVTEEQEKEIKNDLKEGLETIAIGVLEKVVAPQVDFDKTFPVNLVLGNGDVFQLTRPTAKIGDAEEGVTLMAEITPLPDLLKPTGDQRCQVPSNIVPPKRERSQTRSEFAKIPFSAANNGSNLQVWISQGFLDDYIFSLYKSGRLCFKQETPMADFLFMLNPDLPPDVSLVFNGYSSKVPEVNLGDGDDGHALQFLATASGKIGLGMAYERRVIPVALLDTDVAIQTTLERREDEIGLRFNTGGNSANLKLAEVQPFDSNSKAHNLPWTSINSFLGRFLLPNLENSFFPLFPRSKKFQKLTVTIEEFTADQGNLRVDLSAEGLRKYLIEAAEIQTDLYEAASL